MAYEPKTKKTTVKIADFIAAVENDTRREDAKVLAKLFAKVTGWKGYMFGPTIVGFGLYDYTYDSGHSGTACVVGFSPRKANLVIYSGIYPEQAKDILARLGKYKTSKGCIYINKLADIDLAVLEKLLKAGVANMKKTWPITPT